MLFVSAHTDLEGAHLRNDARIYRPIFFDMEPASRSALEGKSFVLEIIGSVSVGSKGLECHRKPGGRIHQAFSLIEVSSTLS